MACKKNEKSVTDYLVGLRQMLGEAKQIANSMESQYK